MTPTKTPYQAQDLFITRVYTFDLPLQQYHVAWLDSIQQLRLSNPQGGGQRSVRHGWKGDFRLFEDPLFEPLCQHLTQCVIQIMKDQGLYLLPRHFKLEGSVNITDPGGYNQLHGHRQNLFSGCYYLDVPPDSGGIEFHEPRLGAKYSPLQPNGPQGSNSILINPKPGQLVLFPCWLEHSVQENTASEPRYSIPINIKPAQGGR